MNRPPYGQSKKGIDFIRKILFAIRKSIYRGVLTGYNKAFIIDKETKDALIKEDPISAEIIKPILRGRSVGRYEIGEINEYLIGTHNGYHNTPRIEVENYPAVKKHLDMFYRKISIRQDKGTTPYNLRNCAYYEEFEKEKIIYSEITQSPQFYLDIDGQYTVEASAFILLGSDLKFLIGVLNSYPFTYIFRKFYAGGGLGNKGYRYKKIFLEEVPIPRITSENKSIKDEVEKYVDSVIDSITNKSESSIFDKKLNNLISQLYSLTPREIEFIFEDFSVNVDI